ncbi:MAG: histidine kinase [Burkholderiales bacterium]|nr:histidine kinase [Burkholderiales bacterium]
MKKTALILYTLAFNTAIAGLLTLISPCHDFRINLIYSQCIGLSIASINIIVLSRIKSYRLRLPVFGLTLPGSVIIGLSLAFYASGTGNWGDPRSMQSVVIGLFFGGIGTLVFLLSEHIGELDAAVKAHELENEKREIEARLKLLQAQIEPHFLFNTLANVSSLIDVDPSEAKHLLEHLNDWLRTALICARSEEATLGDELDLLENYLRILSIRFGERLNWRIEAGDATRSTRFPPMLLQPLVENAVRHGIEPKPGPGEIRIRASLHKDALRVEVADSGAGLAAEPGQGTGLANVRARLAALYGEAGRLILKSNSAGGATCSLELPR